jgi:hypothetical protein
MSHSFGTADFTDYADFLWVTNVCDRWLFEIRGIRVICGSLFDFSVTFCLGFPFPLDLSALVRPWPDEGGSRSIRIQTADACRFASIQQNDRIAGVLVSQVLR